MIRLKNSFDEKYLLSSVKNALKILRLFTPNQTKYKISEMAKILNLPKSSIHRYVKELVYEGFLVQNNSDDSYSLGVSIISLGGIVQAHKEDYLDAQPILESLVVRFNMHAHICVMEQNKVVYIMRETANQPTKLVTRIGRSNDIHCTAEGLMILADKSRLVIENLLAKNMKKHTPFTETNPDKLKKIIRQIHFDQYAITKDTFAIGFTSFAVPIKDYTGSVVSSLALITESQFVKDADYPKIISSLKKEGEKISNIFGYYGN